MTIEVSSYPKSKEGEKRLLIDLFKVIKINLPEEHQEDTLKKVLQSEELFEIYLTKYQEIKKEEVNIGGTNTPCEKDEETAINQLTEEVGKRTLVNQLDPEKRKFFSDKDILEISIPKIEAVEDYLSPKQAELIGGKWLADEGMTAEKIEVLGGLALKEIESIGGKWLADKGMTAEKIEAIGIYLSPKKTEAIGGKWLASEGMTYEKIKAIGENLDQDETENETKTIGGKWLANEGMTMKKIEKIGEILNQKKMEVLGGEWLANKGMTPEKIEALGGFVSTKEMIEKITAIGGGKFLADKRMTVKKIEKIIIEEKRLSIDQIKDNISLILSYKDEDFEILVNRILNIDNDVKTSF